MNYLIHPVSNLSPSSPVDENSVFLLEVFETSGKEISYAAV